CDAPEKPSAKSPCNAGVYRTATVSAGEHVLRAVARRVGDRSGRCRRLLAAVGESRRAGEPLYPRTLIRIAPPEPRIRVRARALRRRNRVPQRIGERTPPVAITAQEERVRAPPLPPDSNANENTELVAALDGASRIGAILLSGDLQRLAMLIPAPEETAIQVGVEVTGVNVRARVRRGAVHAPTSHINADLGRAALDANVVERPQGDLREIPNAVHARIELLELESVEKDADTTGVAEKRADHWLGDPVRPYAGHARNSLEQILHGQRAGRKEVAAVPHEASRRIGEHGRFRCGERWLDRIVDDGPRRITAQ